MNPLSNINTLLNAVLPIWQADQEGNNNVEGEEDEFVMSDDDASVRSVSSLDSELDILLAGGEPVSLLISPNHFVLMILFHRSTRSPMMTYASASETVFWTFSGGASIVMERTGCRTLGILSAGRQPGLGQPAPSPGYALGWGTKSGGGIIDIPPARTWLPAQAIPPYS